MQTFLWPISILLLFQLIGESLAIVTHLPIPGPVIGMGLLFVTLIIRGGASKALNDTSLKLLQQLSLLFVPAGVGVILHVHRIADEWLPITAVLVLSTFIAMAVTVLVLKLLLRFSTSRQ